MTTAVLEPSTSPRVARINPWLLGTLTGLLLGLVAFAFAYFAIFSEMRGDDEGYLMISVKGFIEGHALYDEVFTQYGPFYYFYQWLLRSAAAIPLTHDATRLLGIVHWLTAAGLLGLAGGLMTRSVLGGLFVFMQAVVHLTPMAGEPGHPQELVVLLLALSTLTVAVRPTRTIMPVLLGVIGTALTLTKVNVGVFFGLASLLALLVHARKLQHRAWNTLVLALVAPLPLLLMRAHLGDPWFRNYSLIVVASVVTTFLAANSWSDRQATGLRPWAQLALGFALPTFALLGVTLLHGSSIQGLIDGLITTPLRLPGVGWLRRPVSTGMMPNAALALAVAIAMLRGGPACRSPLPLLKGIYGLVGALWLVGDPGLQLDYLLPWAWLVIAPPAGATETSTRFTFPRAFLAFTAVWQSLQAYPVAGTQVAVGTVVLVVIYTLCLTDAVRELAVRQRLEARWPILAGTPVAAYPWVLALALLFLFQNVWCRPHDAQEHYAQLTALDLPGTRRLRLTTESVILYRGLMEYLERSCDTFITYPGFNSFYFWTGKPPPTFWNATGWGPLSASQRLEVLAALRQARRPLLVIHESPLGSWAHGAPPELEPLVRCLRDECEPVQRFGPFVVFRLRDAARAPE